ncbi:MAG: Flavoredoxin [Lentisphaerae bacterium ADurb.Bin242]|nr:MAG: Flavoredoxin [Lentisphaerae bacterium ADurb.Bin242]
MLKDYPLNKVFMLIEPGPVLLVTTASGRKKNIMTISWSMPTDFSPNIALLTGSWNHSFEALMKTRECVLAVPAADLMKTTVGIGMCSGTDTDKFQKFGLTAGKAQKVRAPLILECLANIECRVEDYVEKHGIVVLNAVKAWIDDERKERRMFHAVGDGRFIVDGRTVNLRKMMEAKLPSGV